MSALGKRCRGSEKCAVPGCSCGSRKPRSAGLVWTVCRCCEAGLSPTELDYLGLRPFDPSVRDVDLVRRILRGARRDGTDAVARLRDVGDELVRSLAKTEVT